MRHSEIALQNLLRVAPALLAHHHHCLTIQPSPATDDCRIVAKCAITVQLYEIREDESDELGRERPLRITCNLNALPRSEVVINLIPQLDELLLERRDFFDNTELLIAGKLLQLVDLPL